LILRLADPADVAAWDDFHQIYRPLILRLALRRGLQAADAEDLTQEVFSSVAGSVAGWLERTNRGGFRAWLLTIARNATVNMLTRRATKRWGIGGEGLAQQLAEVPMEEAACSGEFDLEYRRQVFQWAAVQVRDVVSETTWQAFWLTHGCGMTVEQAAAKLGLSNAKVYVARSRVMARLRDLVSRYEVSS
jgi:RNA polymerase sigma-70 factor (ECF subfamily)